MGLFPSLWPLAAVGVLMGLLLLFGSNLLKRYLDASIMKYIRPAGTLLSVLCIGLLILMGVSWTLQSVRSLTEQAVATPRPVTETDNPAPTLIPTDTPVPLPTVIPTETPVPTLPPNALDPNCMPDAEYSADITIPDGTEFKPGESFTKTWLLLSDGCAIWPENTVLAFESGDQMSAPANVPVTSTAPGSTSEVSVTFTAPAQPGEYTSFWQMQTEGGVRYGNRIYVLIEVVAP